MIPIVQRTRIPPWTQGWTLKRGILIGEHNANMICPAMLHIAFHAIWEARWNHHYRSKHHRHFKSRICRPAHLTYMRRSSGVVRFDLLDD
jgi:hypothetical protein